MIQTFGKLSLKGSNFRRVKPLLVLAYLSVEGSQDRGKLSDMFWPDAKEPRDSLSSTIYQLNREVEGAIRGDRSSVWTDITSDAAALESTLIVDETAALNFYKGSFLKGLDFEVQGKSFELWLHFTRQHYADTARTALLNQAEILRERGAAMESARLAERAFFLPDTSSVTAEDLERFEALSPLNSKLGAHIRQEMHELGMPVSCKAEFIVSPGFLGRERELTEIVTHLKSKNEPLLLFGPAGIGKTRLAKEVLTHFGQKSDSLHAHLITLGSAEPTRLLETIMHSLEAKVKSISANPYKNWHEFFSLIVIDNLEIIEDFEELEDVYEAYSPVPLLFCSRVRPSLSTVMTYPLNGLSNPEHSLNVDNDILSYDAAHLFVDKVRRRDPAYKLSQDDRVALAELCSTVSGSPLTLSLLAAWTAHMSISDILQEVVSEESELLGHAATSTNTFNKSWDLLTEDEKKTLKALSVIQEPFDRQIALALSKASPIIIQNLLDKSLLEYRGGHYELHPLLKSYVSQKLLPKTKEKLLRQHAYVYLRQFRLWQSEIRKKSEAVESISASLSDISSAWLWACQHEPHLILSSADALRAYYIHVGYSDDGLDVFTKSLDSLTKENGDGYEIALVTILVNQAWLYYSTGNLEAASTAGHKALVQGVNVGDFNLFGVYNLLAAVAWRSGNLEDAKAYWEQALLIAEQGEKLERLSASHGNLALVARAIGDLESAEWHLLKTIEMNRRLGFDALLSLDLNQLAGIYIDQRLFSKAENSIKLGLEAAEKNHATADLPYLYANLSLVQFEAGEFELSLKSSQNTAELASLQADISLEASAKGDIARAAFALGELSVGRENMRQSLNLLCRSEDVLAAHPIFATATELIVKYLKEEVPDEVKDFFSQVTGASAYDLNRFERTVGSETIGKASDFEEFKNKMVTTAVRLSLYF